MTPLPVVAAGEAAGAGRRLVHGGRQRASVAFLDGPARRGGAERRMLDL